MKFTSVLYEASHYFAFAIRRPKGHNDQARFVVSIDIDVGSEKLGIINGGTNDSNVHNDLSEREIGRIEGQAIPVIVHILDDLEVPATFAIRGQLLEVDDSVIDLLRQSRVNHEIGAHGYYHKTFPSMPRSEADRELQLISLQMRRHGINPKSFVFPKNDVAHLSLLQKWGYLCFRGSAGLLNDRMFIEKCGNLYDVHPSLYLAKCCDSFFLRKMIDLSIKRKTLLHVWFHLWDFGFSPESIDKRFVKTYLSMLKYVKQKEKESLLQTATMGSLAEAVSLI